MILATAFCHRDAVAALQLLIWLRELSSIERLRCSSMIVGATRLGALHSAYKKIKEIAPQVCGAVSFTTPDEEESRGWPYGPNHIFRHVLPIALKSGKPVLWIEPDSIPTRPTWFKEIQVEQMKLGGFVGAIYEYPAEHMNGVGVYPEDCIQLAPSLMTGKDNVPWDVASSDEHMIHAHNSELFQHKWDHGRITEESISPKAAIFHRDRNGSVVDILAEKVIGKRIASRKDLEETMPTRYYHCTNATKVHRSGGMEFKFTAYTMIGGAVYGILDLSDETSQIAISEIVGTSGITEISESEYAEYLKKKGSKANPIRGSIVYESGNRPVTVPASAHRAEEVRISHKDPSIQPQAQQHQAVNIAVREQVVDSPVAEILATRKVEQFKKIEPVARKKSKG